MADEVSTDVLGARERRELIEEARKLDPNVRLEYKGPGAFEGADDPELAIALDIIVGHGFDDRQEGDVDIGLHGARVGRCVLWTDGQGFKTVSVYESESDAEDALVESAPE